MNIRKVKDVFLDWMRGGYYFGFYFSDSAAAKLEIAPKAALAGGMVFDVAAGGGLTYLAVTQAIGSVLWAGAAIGAVGTAPVSAVVVPAVAVVFLALNCMMAGIGVGLLNAARIKSGISSPAYFARKSNAAVAGAFESTRNTFKAGTKKLAASFKNVVGRGEQPAKKPAQKPSADDHLKF